MPVTSVIKHKYSGLKLFPPTYRTKNTGSNSWNNKNQLKSISARNLQGTVGLLNSSPSWWGRMTCCRCWTSYWSSQHTICSEIPSPLRPLSSPDQRSDIVLPGSPRELQPRNLNDKYRDHRLASRSRCPAFRHGIIVEWKLAGFMTGKKLWPILIYVRNSNIPNTYLARDIQCLLNSCLNT